MEETGQEEVRPGSANSDNGLDGGFVEVTEEDAQMAAGWEQSRSDPTSALDEDADLYGDDRAGGDEGGAGDGEEEAPDDEEKVRTTPNPRWSVPAPERSLSLSLVGVMLDKHHYSRASVGTPSRRNRLSPNVGLFWDNGSRCPGTGFTCPRTGLHAC